MNVGTAKLERVAMGDRIFTQAQDIAGRLPEEYSGMTTLRKITELEHQLEMAKRSVVGQMRAEGWTWIRIGEALGVSKQAAQKKYQL